MNTVLIIDDDPDYRQFMGDLLKRHGWNVLEAESGDGAMELANRHQPDAVLAGHQIASVNKFELCRSLRSADKPRHTKIVVVSDGESHHDRQSALRAGADECITKPIDPERLVLVLSRAVARSGRSEAPKAPGMALAGAPTRVKFWGVRGSIPTPGPTTVHYGGNTSCIELRADGQIIVLDAGTGLRLLGQQLDAEFERQPLELTLLLTHTHWDHIQGLPFFLPVYKPQNHLRILGYEGARRGLEVVLAGQMESPFFPIGLREVPANVRIEELKEMEFNIGPVRVQAAFANHPGTCVGYRLFTSEGSIAFFPDNEPFPEMSSATRTTGAGGSAVVTFDRSENRKLIDFLCGVDVLIMDTQYDVTEYKHHTGWGHGCLDDVVALALQAEVKALYLFHHDPNHDDAKVSQMLAHAQSLVAARKGRLRVEAAREGVTIELPAAVRA